MTKDTNTSKRVFIAQHPLEVKMVLGVTLAVTLVTIAFAIVISKIYNDTYERELRAEISNSIDQSTTNISLVMGYVENAIQTTSEYIEKEAINIKNLDSIIKETLRGFGKADKIGIIYRKNFFPGKDYYYESNAYYDKEGAIHVKKYKFDPIGDENWEASFIAGKPFWSDPYVADLDDGEGSLICFSTPLHGEDGKPYAIFYASVQLKWISPIVDEYKACKDIDVSIYSKDEQCIVQQIEEIAKMDKEDLIIEQRELKKLGWKLVFSVPKDYVTAKVNKVLLAIAFFAVLLLLSVIIAILISVVTVARPFVREQKSLAESKARMQKEMDIAAETQHDIVPHIFPPFPERKDVEIFAMLEPALNVGGDLYDYFIQDEKLYFCIGDVSGKGMPASLFMSATRYLFRSQASSLSGLSSAVENINRSLCTDNANCTFVTFFCGCLDLQTGVMQYCNAGHNFPIIHNAATGDVSFLNKEETGMPLGVYDEAEYNTYTLQMEPEDTLFLYTDGVTEAMNEERQELGDEETLKCISNNITSDTTAIITAMRHRISEHAEGATQSDDITMLCIRRMKG